MVDSVNALESKLLREIATINSRIKEMEQERRSLERLLVRSRRENVAAQEIARISSGSRIIVERSIIGHLRALNGRSSSTSDLKRVAESIELRIKDSTFRSHLHRLKLKGLIQSAGHGRWQLGSIKLD